MIVLNGCGSLFSALVTVLCDPGGKWMESRGDVSCAGEEPVAPLKYCLTEVKQ